jgi:hypothetical protein
MIFHSGSPHVDGGDLSGSKRIISCGRLPRGFRECAKCGYYFQMTAPRLRRAIAHVRGLRSRCRCLRAVLAASRAALPSPPLRPSVCSLSLVHIELEPTYVVILQFGNKAVFLRAYSAMRLCHALPCIVMLRFNINHNTVFATSNTKLQARRSLKPRYIKNTCLTPGRDHLYDLREGLELQVNR